MRALDITIKSSTTLGAILAPTWELVLGHKAGNGDMRYIGKYDEITDQQYTERYLELLRSRYRLNTDGFLAILAKPTILCCYCVAGKFCHRHIAIDVLVKVSERHGIEVIKVGEV